MYIKIKRLAHKIKNMLCVCVWWGEVGVLGREGGKGTGELIHFFKIVRGWGRGDGEGVSLISNCIEKSSQ